jgi:hypothetical protein
MREESQPDTTPSPASNTAVNAISPASHTTTATSLRRMPSSTMCRTSSGDTTTRHASTMVSARNTLISRRCGRAAANTRRTV